MLKKSPSVDYWGVALAAIAGVLSAVMAIATKSAAGEMSAATVLWIRSSFLSVIFFPFFFGLLRRLHWKRDAPVLLRSIFGSLSVLCFFLNLQTLSTSSALIFVDSYPIILLFLAFFLLREVPTVVQIGATVVFTLCVGLMHGLEHFNTTWYNTLLGIAGAVCFALALVFFKKSVKSYTSFQILWFYSLATVMVLVPFERSIFADLRAVQASWVPLMVVIAATLGAQLALAGSLKRISSGLAGTWALSGIPLAYCYELFQARRLPSGFELLVLALAVVSLAVVTLSSSRSARLRKMTSRSMTSGTSKKYTSAKALHG